MEEANIPQHAGQQPASAEAAPKRPDPKELEKSFIVYVQDTKLAAAMGAVGFQLRDDPPYTHKEMANEEDVVSWHFNPVSVNKMFQAIDMIRAYKNQVEWGQRNPDHPFTIAMDAVKNFITLTDHIKRDIPFVGFWARNGRACIFVKKGSHKHENCKKIGLRQI